MRSSRFLTTLVALSPTACVLFLAAQGALAQKAAVPAEASSALPPTPPAGDAHAAPTGSEATGPTTALTLEGVHNAFRWTDKIISGSCPAGESGFKALAAQGVQTILSVDGAAPEAAVAKKYGLRYVHIPVEYSGITKEDAIKIARVVRDLPGPIFIHCHHGIHRGPAATALAAIALAKFTNEQALAGLQQAGTGQNYQGLWKVVREFQAPTQAEIDAADHTFPESSTVEALAGHMVNIDMRWANLGEVKAAGWKVPPAHPDIEPAHEALLLREGFREAARVESNPKFPADFLRRMSEAEAASAALEAALRAREPEKAGVAFEQVKTTCGSCHKTYRDNKAD